MLKIRIRSLLGANFFTLGERTQTFEFVAVRPFVPSSLGVISFREAKSAFTENSLRGFQKDIMRIYRSLKKTFFCASLQLDRKNRFADGSAMGSVKVMGRDSGLKGAYAHQYLDRGHKTKTLKPKAIFVF